MKKIKSIKNIVYMIPTYNEMENIVPMLNLVYANLRKLKKYSFDILVVDDNSPDGTGDLVKKVSSKKKNISLLSGQKRGLGMAMIRGYKYAMTKLKADIIISNEADFSYDPSKLLIMIKKIEEGYDLVLGSRRLINTSKWPMSRRIIHYIANDFFAKGIAGVWEVDDHNSAFKAIRVNGVLDQIDFKDFPKGFAFFNYFTFKVTQITPKIYEFKTTFRPRTKGVSKMLMKDGIEYAKTCFKIRFEKLFK